MSPESTPVQKVLRALRLRCPHCGRGRMFFRWVRTYSHCIECDFKYDRGEDDYYIGAYTLNLIFAELIVVAAMVFVIIRRWPDVPWTTLPWALASFAVLGPLITYPFSKSLWLAIDLLFRPAEANDFVSRPSARGGRP